MSIALPEDKALWERIQAYSFDENKNALESFLDKLCKETKWSRPFAKSAIEEYRRFVFLCCVLPNGASPSDVVDKVWHLHLTYTKSYWEDFCKNVLRKTLHHYPSDGSLDKSRSLKNKYTETLLAYHTYFDQMPLDAYWPRSLVVAEYNHASVFPRKYVLILVSAALVFPWFQGKFFAYHLEGEQFLVFYICLIAIGFVLLFLDKFRFSEAQQEFIRKNISNKPNSFQISYYLYGSHHALQAAIINLVDCKILKIKKDSHFEIVKDSLPVQNENLSVNPLRNYPLNYTEKSLVSYEEIGREWFKSSDFEHFELDAIKTHLRTKRFTFPLIFIPAVGIIRIGQGLINDQPVWYLIMELVVAIVLYLLAANFVLNHNDDFKDAITNIYFPKDKDRDSTDLFALEGRSILASLTFGFLLMDVFPRYDRTGQRMESSCSSCSSACSSSGGDSGGGDSGGGDGGGCGGCGGGGD